MGGKDSHLPTRTIGVYHRAVYHAVAPLDMHRELLWPLVIRLSRSLTAIQSVPTQALFDGDLFLLGYPSPGSASHGKQGSEEAEEAWRASGVTSRSNKSQFDRVPLRRKSSEPFALDR